MRIPTLFPPRVVIRVVSLLCVLTLLAAARPAAAQSLRETTSLKFVPADAAFYSASLRLRQQFDTLAGSKAVARLKQIPALQFGLLMAQAQWNNPGVPALAEFKAALEEPQNKQLVELVIDAVSQEIFFYGDEGYAQVVDMLNAFNRANRSAQFAQLRGERSEEAVAREMVQVVIKHLDTFETPDSVCGFKISDPDAAQAQLARLEELLTGALADQPQIQERLGHEQIGGVDYLTLKLDGTLIPWDELPEDAREEFESVAGEDAEKLIEKIKKMTLVVSLGVRDGYLLLSVGDSNEHLKALGQGDLLVDRPEIQRLAGHGDRPLAALSYVSQSFMETASSPERQWNDLIAMAEQLAPLAKLDAETEKELLADVKSLGEQVRPFLPQPGAVASVTFLTDFGYEGFKYNWGENRHLDASQPLTILDHVGGNPLCLVAARGVHSPEGYDLLTKFCQRAFYYGDKIAQQHLEGDEREFYETVRDQLKPQLARLDKATRELLIPALKDGQFALVVDAQTTSTQWHEKLPVSETPLPILEIGLVYGVSDAAKLKEAAGEYFAVVQEVLDILHDAEPDEIPEVKLPPPESREFDGGTVYYYRLPQQAGFDNNLAPNAGLSDSVLALTAIPRFTTRLLGSQPVSVNSPLIFRQRVAGAVGHFNFAGFIDAITPWVDYGLQLGFANNEAGLPAVRDQVHIGLDVLKCFRGGTSVTYQEQDTWVTHFESRFVDLEEEEEEGSGE